MAPTRRISTLLALLLLLNLAALSAETLDLRFDGRPGPFVPSKVGERVRLEARLVGNLIPLRLCSLRIPGQWAVVKLDHDGIKGWLTVRKLAGSGRKLERPSYELQVSLRVQGKSQSLREPSLHLRPEFVMYRLEGAVLTAAEQRKSFPLQGNPELLPIRRADIYTYPPPPRSKVWLRGKEIWVGAPALPSDVDGRTAEVTVRPLIVAIRVRPRKGSHRWLYLNLAPNAAVREGWDDEGSQLTLPPFQGSEAYYGKVRSFFRAKGVPFQRIGG